MRLFGLMVVRNAADLLAVGIPHHLAQGVERFLVFDHASTDATADVLAAHAARGALEWSRVEGPFRKESWINQLALEAYLQGAEWVVPIDADEFWTGDGAPIAARLAGCPAAALEARIFHFIQQVDQLESAAEGLLRMVYRVGLPAAPAEPAADPASRPDLPPFLAEATSPKWISRAGAGLWIDRGNHRVEGLTGPAATTAGIVCLHAPLRSRAALLDRHRPLPALDPLRRPGESWHLERWKELGTDPAVVDREWRRSSARGAHIAASGLPLVRDTRLRDAIRPWVEALRSGSRAGSFGTPVVSSPAQPAGGETTGRAREQGLGEALRHLRRRLQERDQKLAERDGIIAERDRIIAERDGIIAERDRIIAELRAELAAGSAGPAARELAVWRSVQSSRFFRLWMASIRLRRALRLAPPALAAALPPAAAAAGAASAGAALDLAAQGFAGPFPLFSGAEAHRLLHRLRADPPRAREWGKDGAASSRSLYEIAAYPPLVRVVAEALGGDAVLWGASLIQRQPGEVHPWHTDIESSGPEGGTVSVWIGMENVTAGSALRIVPYSHRFGAPIQEVAGANGLRRGEARTEDVERWARARDGRSGVVPVAMGDGDALFFDGRLWHGTANETALARTALLLQYATARRPIRIPDVSVLEAPFRFLAQPLAPCLRIAGPGGRAGSFNRVVNPPPRSAGPGGPPLPPLHRPIPLPAATDPQTGWKPYPLFHGTTPNLASLSCHFSVLAPDRCPHPPHRHAEEELLLVLDGAAELVVADAAGREECHPARRGHLAYYPAGCLHTLRTPAASGATYVMLKWTGRAAPSPDAMTARVLDAGASFALAGAAASGGFVARRLFEEPTLYLDPLHCHATTLAPGAWYEPHRDDHDVAIVVLEGTVEALGEELGPNGVLFVPAGEPHGMANPGAGTARYLVFEFHGRAPHAVDLTGFEIFG